MNTTPLYALAVAFFFIGGGSAGLALGVAHLVIAVTLDSWPPDTPGT